MKKALLYIPILLLLLSGCEKQIPIDIEDLEAKVVVHAQGETDSPLSMTITKSIPVFGISYTSIGGSQFPKVTDAQVSITVNGSSTPITASNNNNHYSLPYIPQEGDHIDLRIDVPGYPTLSSSTTVPAKPIVGDLQLTESRQTNIDGYEEINLSLFVPLTDPETTADYYCITMERYDTVFYIYYNDNGAIIDYDTLTAIVSWFECQDQLIVTDIDPADVLDGAAVPIFFGSEMLFSDQRINGVSHNIELDPDLYLGSYQSEGYYHNGEYSSNFTYTVHTTFVVDISTLTRDDYLYRKTLQSLLSAYGDDLLEFFSEPEQLHSNIDGGIGIFSINSKKTLTYHHIIEP
jgi:hypothetical protein